MGADLRVVAGVVALFGCGGETTVDRCDGDGECDDGLVCNGVEVCGDLGCERGTALPCDDGVDCTVDVCGEPDGCLHVPDDRACPNGACNPVTGCEVQPQCAADGDCDDGVFCNGAETCADGSCIAGDSPECDDDVLCTLDVCDGVADACASVPDHAACDPGALCDVLLGCVDQAECDAAADCDDGLSCNGRERCSEGECRAGQAMKCDDGIDCTVDVCDEATDGCAAIPDPAGCGPGGACDPEAGCIGYGGSAGNAGLSCSEVLAVLGVALDGVYWLDTDGGGASEPFEAYCDMTRDGGGWTLVLQNVGAVTPGPDPVYEDVVSSVNVTGAFGDDLTAFDLFLGLEHWNRLGTRMRIEVGPEPGTISKQALYDYALDPGASWAISLGNGELTVGPDEPGLRTYHAAAGYGMTTSDHDVDEHAQNCQSFYGYAWWYGACWSGSFWGSRLGNYSDNAYWTSSGGDFYLYGALWVR